MSGETIEEFYVENRTFPPSSDFVREALASDRSMYDEAEADYEAFWARQARELLSWSKDFDTVLEWELPNAKWFLGGELNVTYNCLDRHVEAGRGDKVAYHWEGEPGDKRTISYADLLADVSRFAIGAEAFCYRLLDEAGVLMFPGNSFGDRWENWVRVSLLAPEESVREAIGRMRGFVAGLDAQ